MTGSYSLTIILNLMTVLTKPQKVSNVGGVDQENLLTLPTQLVLLLTQRSQIVGFIQMQILVQFVILIIT